MILGTHPQLLRLSERLIFKSNQYGHPHDCECWPVKDFIDRIDQRELEAFSSGLRSYLGLDFEPFAVNADRDETILETVNPLVGGIPDKWIVKTTTGSDPFDSDDWSYPTCGSLFIERVEYWIELVNEYEPEPCVEVAEVVEPKQPNARQTTNELLTQLFTENPTAKTWTQSNMAKKIGRSKSSVGECQIYKTAKAEINHCKAPLPSKLFGDDT
ncbi:hypothetical protein OAE32_00950 [bacterium]|nr:hypothetical protein [bacterium]